MKFFIVASIALLLGGCVSPIPASQMTPDISIYQQIESNPKLEKKIKIGRVEVNKNASSRNDANINAVEFQNALTNSLLTANYLIRGGNEESYILDAEIVAIKQPFMGFNLSVDTEIKYDLHDKGTGRSIYDDTLKLSGETRFSEAFDGILRLRMATAKAMSENITHLLRVLGNLDVE